MIPDNDIKALFEAANQSLLTCDKELFENQVSERTLCGALMLHFYKHMKKPSKWKHYHADVEYNRNKGSIRGFKTIYSSGGIIRINCDLIVHSRGHITEQDNLIAIEMKKSSRPQIEKNKDRERLIVLTSTPPDGEYIDCPKLPEHVCGYTLGIYYEINYHRRSILIEYYRHGEIAESSTLYF